MGKCSKCGNEKELDREYYDLCRLCGIEFDVNYLKEEQKRTNDGLLQANIRLGTSRRTVRFFASSLEVGVK